MYQFPTWRYWLVAIVMIAGILLALPNIFGDDPALQLAREDRAAIDASGEQKVRSILDAKQVPIAASHILEDRLVLRFATVDEQLKARDVITDAAGEEFQVALTNEPRTPSWLRWMGLKPMSLGLDLRGGIHFMYEVDVKGAVGQALERIERDIRTQLRDQRIASNVAARDGTIRVTLVDAQKQSEVASLIRTSDPNLTVTTEGSADVIVAMTPDQIRQRQSFAIQQNITTLRNRVNELGVSEPIVTQQGIDRIVVQLPGLQDPNQAIRILGATATLEFRMVDEANDPYAAEQSKRVPIGSKLYQRREGGPILLKRDIIVSGDQLTDATSAFAEGLPAVSVRLDDRGGKEMLKTTQAHLGQRMAVVYIEKKRLAPGETCKGVRSGDQCTEEEVINAATIQGVFSSNFQITGLQHQEAQELALLLRSGSLATANYLVEQRVIGPSMGQDNIQSGLRAMMIGMALTFVFLILYYRAFGAIACVVLAANVILLVAVMSLLQASLSLPGIAGIVLTVGMAADANVLIYERVREELRLGNTPQASINAGFDKAFSAIADSNITTLIVGIVLFAFGTGPIKGFAVTLVIGIATSLFTAVVGSRVLIQLIWGRQRKLAALPV
ncbi:preprotein translocase subunit SecD [Povalibacter uvarum]|uniref:Protein translocase subunit SecD n=1 Tax=Povalibacter uvarum TaxID=732238 RepID=A0A841HT84_9GAMM|nr:protein translocase subunit SecD [Povalibacter uvarum]MBB6096557.1 preprotein translocase subunit SecD [Povalibacter uvarum]